MWGGAGPAQAEQYHPFVGDGGGCQSRPQAGQQFIVGIQEQDPVAGGGVQAGVAGRTGTAVGTVQSGDPGIPGSQTVTQGTGVVGTAVLHQQQLQILGCTLQGAGHCTLQGGGGLVTGDDDGRGPAVHRVSSCKMVV